MSDYKELLDLVNELNEEVDPFNVDDEQYKISTKNSPISKKDSVERLKALLEALESGSMVLINNISMEDMSGKTAVDDKVNTEIPADDVVAVVNWYKNVSEKDGFLDVLNDVMNKVEEFEPEEINNRLNTIEDKLTGFKDQGAYFPQLIEKLTETVDVKASLDNLQQQVTNLDDRINKLNSDYGSLASHIDGKQTSLVDKLYGLKEELQNMEFKISKLESLALMPNITLTSSATKADDIMDRKSTEPMSSKPYTETNQISNETDSALRPNNKNTNLSSVTIHGTKVSDEEKTLITKFQETTSLIRFGINATRLCLNHKDAVIRAEKKIPFISLAQSKEVPLIDTAGGSPMYYAFEVSREMNTFYVTPAQKMYTTDNIQGIGLEEFFDIRGELRQSDLNRFSLDAPAIFKKVEDNFVIERRGVITVL